MIHSHQAFYTSVLKELLATYDRERLRQLGDIVTANLHRITKGQTLLQAEDFYDEDMALIDIPLSPLLSPQQNAAKFYKDYARMKTAEKELTNQITLGQQELVYLESVLEELNRAQTEAELEEIRRELQDGGYIKADSIGDIVYEKAPTDGQGCVITVHGCATADRE